ncbi:MAG: MFS transporter [Burkholderiales bacterium]|nr:MFS transporter [Burkholderiales bacterium]
MTAKKNHSWTLLILCLGYFIDFYDLTIMGVSYNELIREHFQITDQIQVQQTYLLISNFQTLGIFIGAILFGILGDKIGRAKAIRYSILIYSISTIAAVYTTSLPLFIALRTIAYIGLATEFSTSTVLILELFPIRSSAWGMAILYSFGVLGGITATSIGMISWQAMFIGGGLGGIILYLARSKIHESESYIEAKLQNKKNLGNFKLLICDKKNLLKIIMYFFMILPYFLLITSMFIYPNYIIKNITIANATKTLLLGFFVGNILSSLLSGFFFNHKKYFMFLSLTIFIILTNIYTHINDESLMLYSLGLGLIGGGYPIIWAQLVANSFPIHIRSTASNLLFALGRGSSILFNSLITTWIVVPELFVQNEMILVAITALLAFIVIWKINPKSANS